MAKVLLVDDELTLVQMVGDLLRAEGHEREARRDIVVEQPRLVSMRRLEHLELVREARAQRRELVGKQRLADPEHAQLCEAVTLTLPEYRTGYSGGYLSSSPSR